MKSTTDAPPPRLKPNVTRAYIEHGELDPYREDIAAQQSVHLTALRYGLAGFMLGFVICAVVLAAIIIGGR